MISNETKTQDNLSHTETSHEVQKFSTSSNPTDVLMHYEREGFAIFKDVPIQDITGRFREEFRHTLELVYRQVISDHAVDINTQFDQELMQLYHHNRTAFSNFWNASQTLIGLYGLLDNASIIHCLKLTGNDYPVVAWTPNLRVDCPNDDAFILPDHQDRHYNGGSQNSCTVYFQANEAEKERGRLRIRPRSHKLGSLPYTENTVKPYFYLHEGPWQQIPEIELPLENNDLVIFHMDLVHRSAPNRGVGPRITFQLRYSNLLDKDYRTASWAPTFLAKTTPNNIGLNHSKRVS